MSREIVLSDARVGGVPEWELVAGALDAAASVIGAWPRPSSDAVGIVMNRAQATGLRDLHVVELGPQIRRIPAWSIDQILGRPNSSEVDLTIVEESVA